jgi:YidC/Oxa1 family membrane protein insertase
MEKRVLLAVSLSFLVLLVYQTLFVKPPPKRPPVGATQAPVNVPGGGSPRKAEETPSATLPETTAEPQAIVAESAARDVIVESDYIRALFSNRGGELKSWTLNRFADDHGRPVDLVPTGAPAAEPRGFALIADDAALTNRLGGALYRASTDRVRVGTNGGQLVFEYQDASGLQIRKQFDFQVAGNPYLVGLTAQVTVNGAPVRTSVSSGPGLGDTDRATGGSAFSPTYYQKPQGIYFLDGKVTRLPEPTLLKQPRVEGHYKFIGVDDHYFLSSILPGGRNTRVDYRVIRIETAAGPRELVAYDARVAGGLRDARFYLGPKSFDALAAVDRDLTRVINFGIFAWLVVPLLRSLNWVNSYVGNYGWSIIILTILINAAIFPLRHKSVVSMRKLQDLQPEVKAIQARYEKLKATDPQKQKMNVELMNLYRERGVNPASGCVPMLLTFPVLFAFYALLSQAIELRGAPFVGWITDLSRHDPWYVTPLLMGATMVWQQRLTPTSADPVQHKMMMFMPVLFTFMFLWAPSGLVIYWFVSNVWAIGQQYLTNYLIGPPAARPARPAAERRVKTASGT